MLTLWDLLPGRVRKAIGVAPVSLAPPVVTASAPLRSPARARRSSKSPKADLYEAMAKELLATHGIRVRRWRKAMSGVAWELRYRDGRTAKLIEAPRPRRPMSAAIFLHEVGHHVLGLGAYRPRCLEEYHAWRWAIEEMERRGIEVTDRVRARMHDSLHYAVEKARRRGLNALPEELRHFSAPRPGR